MGVINELMKEIKSSDLDQQVREICNKIILEEKENTEYELPKGPNIFLSIICPGTFQKEIGCLCLEREMRGTFIVSFWSKLKTSKSNFKKIKVWDDTKIMNEANKILQFYAKTLKYLKGDI